MVRETPEQKFKNEHHALLDRWLEESDIDCERMIEIVEEDSDEWLEDKIEFESDIDLGDDEDAED
jgi:hypothetical protein